MHLKFGIVMDPISRINIKKDTSFAMLLEAQARGWSMHYMRLNDLYLRNGRATPAHKHCKYKGMRPSGLILQPNRI